VTLDGSTGKARVLLVPGAGSSVHGYFPQLTTALGTHATVIEVDPPGFEISSDRRWLRFSDYALGLAQAVRRTGDDPVVVVGHSLGGLIALQLAVQEPSLVAGLLLLDTAPLMPTPVLTLMALSLKASAGLRAVGRRGGHPRARIYTPPRSVPPIVRMAWYLLCDGPALAADLGAGKLSTVPTVVVSAGEHAVESLSRRTHERLVAWIPSAELQVWEGTGHGLHLQRPDRVTLAALALLERAS
jgi:pimeloyl-ACP methyl ester carboxylesterase